MTGDDHILLIGGYGNLGRLIASLMATRSVARITLAGRDGDRAAAAAAAINKDLPTGRVDARRLDVSNGDDLKAALKGVDLVLVAAGTIAHAGKVAAAALEAGADYFDVQLSSPQKHDVLEGLRQRIESEGRWFVSDGGSHPGLPAALVRHASTHFDTLETAEVGMLMQLDWRSLEFSPTTIEEFITEIRDYQPLVLQQGKWQALGWRDFRRFAFVAPFGERTCTPMFLHEMAQLPSLIPDLHETGLLVAGFNWFVDYLVLPFSLAAFKIWPNSQRIKRALGALMHWGLKAFAKPPYAMIMVLEANGRRAGRPASLRLEIRHEDAYVLTAAAVTSCLLQRLDGSLSQPGLWCQATVVDTDRLLNDLQDMGASVRVVN